MDKKVYLALLVISDIYFISIFISQLIKFITNNPERSIISLAFSMFFIPTVTIYIIRLIKNNSAKDKPREAEEKDSSVTEEKPIPIRLRDGESLLAEAMASYIDKYGGSGGMGGYLQVTNERIIYKPNMRFLEAKDFDIPFEQVAEVATMNSYLIIPNMMAIITKSGEMHFFGIWRRKRLIDIIRSHIG